MSKVQFRWEEEQTAFCCGQVDIGDFSTITSANPWDTPRTWAPNPGILYTATTVSSQRDVVKWLKKRGFKKLKRWRNSNTKNHVTLWGYVKKARTHV